MAQDLAATGVELPALMTAGRWKSSKMPARYTERQAAGRGAVARYYQESGGWCNWKLRQCGFESITVALSVQQGAILGVIASRQLDWCIAGKVVATDFQCHALSHLSLVSGNLWDG